MNSFTQKFARANLAAVLDLAGDKPVRIKRRIKRDVIILPAEWFAEIDRT